MGLSLHLRWLIILASDSPIPKTHQHTMQIALSSSAQICAHVLTVCQPGHACLWVTESWTKRHLRNWKKLCSCFPLSTSSDGRQQGIKDGGWLLPEGVGLGEADNRMEVVRVPNLLPLTQVSRGSWDTRMEAAASLSHRSTLSQILASVSFIRGWSHSKGMIKKPIQLPSELGKYFHLHCRHILPVQPQIELTFWPRSSGV